MTSPGFIGRAGPPRRVGPPLAGRPATGELVDVLGEPLTEALCLAALAPSSHNAQPWLVLAHSPRRWSLALAPDRLLPAVDPADREALLSLGAFLENLIVAASDLGVDVHVEGYGDRPDGDDLVRLGLYPGGDPFPRTTAALVSRRTLRRPFREASLRTADLAALADGATGLAWVPGGSARAERIVEILAGAIQHQAERHAAQEEFAEWLRWSDEEIALHRDGLTAAGLGLDGPAGWYARRFFDHDTAVSRAFRRHATGRAVQAARACGGWFVVSAQAPGVAGCIEAGRVFERLFLRARGLGVGIHPMSQPFEEPGWTADLESTLAIEGYPRLLLRVGYVDDYPPPDSPRLPPAAFTRILYRPTGLHRRQRP